MTVLKQVAIKILENSNLDPSLESTALIKLQLFLELIGLYHRRFEFRLPNSNKLLYRTYAHVTM